MTFIQTLVIGLFGGFGVVITWEGLVRPQVERGRVARMLFLEMEENLFQLLCLKELFRRVGRETPPSNLALGSAAYRALGGSVGYLPTKPLRWVVKAYRHIDYLSRSAENWQSLALRRTKGGFPAKASDPDGLLARNARAWVESLDTAVENWGEQLPLLAKYAWPAWAPNRRKGLVPDLLERAAKAVAGQLDKAPGS